MTRSILGALGEEVFVEDETYLDMATGVIRLRSRVCLPLYRSLIDAGVHMGFPRRIASSLSCRPSRVRVVLRICRQAPRHVANQVTSPGGTSAEALYYLEKAGSAPPYRARSGLHTTSLELGKEKPGHIDPHDEEA